MIVSLKTMMGIVILGLIVSVVSFGVVSAENIIFPECLKGGAGDGTEFCDAVNSEQAVTGNNSLTTNVINVIVLVSGAIAVIMIIIGGLRYVLSSGDPQGTQSAKNTILYAIVGVIVAVAARSIVLFVLDRI